MCVSLCVCACVCVFTISVMDFTDSPADALYYDMPVSVPTESVARLCFSEVSRTQCKSITLT